MRPKIIRVLLCLIALNIFTLNTQTQFASLAQNEATGGEKQAITEKKDNSALVSLDVKDADIKDIMRLFSQVSGLNIIVSDDVKATVTLSVSDCYWEDALNMILRTNNLTSVKEGKFLRIMTFDKLRQEEDGVPLVNETVSLNFAKAEEIVAILDPMRSTRGRVTAHTQTNTVVITDTPDNYKKMIAVIDKLDRRTAQVMIEALMLDVKLTDEDRLGINWTISDKDVPSRSITQTLTAGRTEGVIRYGKTLFPRANFTALVDFWAQNKKAEILANPKVLTLDGLTANIELNDEIPYLSSEISSSTGAVTTTASFREAGIKLYVTPHISIGGFISLNIKTEQSFQSSTVTTTAGSQPVIDSRKAETNLLVSDGETIVIGGLRKKETTSTVDKLPVLGDIPVLGKLFRRDVKEVINTELLIFVTPYIINESQLLPTEEKNLQKFRLLKDEKGGKDALDKARPFSLRDIK